MAGAPLKEPYLSIIVPAYNEEKRILATLEQLLEYAKRQSYHTEVLVVSDGSTDATASLVRGLAGAHPELLLLEREHRGKGHAVKVGMLEARGAYRFLCDADLAMPVEEIGGFLPPVLEGVDVAVGSREVSGARRYHEPAYRHLMGRLFNWTVRALAVRGIRDTQCGFKCFTSDAARRLFSQQRLDGFGFDVEALFLAQRYGLHIVEVPINWYYQAESKVRPVRDALRMLADLFRVRWNLFRGRYRLTLQEGDTGPGSEGRDADDANARADP